MHISISNIRRRGRRFRVLRMLRDVPGVRDPRKTSRILDSGVSGSLREPPGASGSLLEPPEASGGFEKPREFSSSGLPQPSEGLRTPPKIDNLRIRGHPRAQERYERGSGGGTGRARGRGGLGGGRAQDGGNGVWGGREVREGTGVRRYGGARGYLRRKCSELQARDNKLRDINPRACICTGSP